MPPLDKTFRSAEEAVRDVFDGAVVAIGGFGVLQGWPASLVRALARQGARALTLVCNTPGFGPFSPQILAERGQLRRLVASFAAYPTRPTPIEKQIGEGKIELELVPQGTLVERLRAAGAGLAAFYTPAGADTEVAHGKERRRFGEREYVLEKALPCDFGFVRAARADRHGNLVYRRGARNFNPAVAMASRVTIAEVDEIVEPGELDPEAVVTPGIYVDRVVRAETKLDRKTVLDLSARLGKHQDLGERSVPGVPPGVVPELMAHKVATLLRPGEYVNLGLGLPTLVSNFVDPESGVTLHAENGILGYGGVAPPGEEDPDLYNASGQLVQLRPGASFFDSVAAFAMARSGRVTTVVLGGFQVDEQGNLANWHVPGRGVGGIGGAMDLVAGRARVIALLYHTDRAGQPKLVRRCSYPVTAHACVRTVVTNLGVFSVTESGFLLEEIAPGVTVEEVRRFTGAPIGVSATLREMF